MEERPDSVRPVDWVAIENQDLAGEQERQHRDVEIGYETLCGRKRPAVRIIPTD